ncbi:testis-expressed protein 264 homolog [Conger conger]|uniref:testis-expressed protein 264 homolog n=1 Tax=Conger conger TaxID=82655 RepID=UPI002A59BE52|nr:testis-expressed protein 264 homolog [Conger conger]
MSDLLILALIVLLIVSLLVTVFGFLLYSGLLSDVDIRTGSPPIKNITIAYKYKEGPYKECGSTFTESCSIGPKLYCIGVYYDDPKTVPDEKCRYAVGNILSEGEEKPDEELVRQYRKFGFNIFSFPEVKHAVSTAFPNRTPLSYLLGIYRVYPLMTDYIKERQLEGSCFLEIYKEEVIQYMYPLSHINDFYVPEAREKEKEEEEESEEDGQMELTETSPLLPDVDSSSDAILLSQQPMSESRDAPLAPPTAATLPEQEPEGGGSNGDRVSESEDSASSFEELELELGRGQEGKDCPPATEATSMTPDLPTNEQSTVGKEEE